MPSKSGAQQRLMGMAWAVRKGELKRSEVNKEVLDIADSDMPDKDLKAFASTSHKGKPDHLRETLEESLQNQE